MTTTPHKTAAADQIHRITNTPFANAAARITAGASLDSTNIDKAFYETSTGTYWIFLGAGLWQLLGNKRPLITDSTTARTFGMSDAEAYFRFTNGASITGTIPPNSSVAFPIGTVLECLQASTGQFAFAAGAGVTFGPGTLFGSAGVGKVIRARKVATDTWDITGDTAAVAGGTITFHTLITGVTVLHALQSDLGITSSGGIISQWNDQSGNGLHATQATAGSRPAVGTGLNGFPSVVFDGVDDSMGFALNLPAPGTTPTWIWFVGRIVSGNAARNNMIVCSTDVAGMALWSPNSTKTVAQFNGSSANSNTATNTSAWGRGESLFSNSTSDYVKFITTVTTGTNAGNTDPPGTRTIASDNVGGALNVELLALIHCNGDPGTTVKNALSAAVTTKYGGLAGV